MEILFYFFASCIHKLKLCLRALPKCGFARRLCSCSLCLSLSLAFPWLKEEVKG